MKFFNAFVYFFKRNIKQIPHIFIRSFEKRAKKNKRLDQRDPVCVCVRCTERREDGVTSNFFFFFLVYEGLQLSSPSSSSSSSCKVAASVAAAASASGSFIQITSSKGGRIFFFFYFKIKIYFFLQGQKKTDDSFNLPPKKSDWDICPAAVGVG